MQETQKLSLEETLEKYGHILKTVEGRSMLPILKAGETVVKLKPYTSLAEGDVALFKRKNGQYVLHRIITLKKRYAVLAGDNCIDSEKVNYSDILAVMDGYFYCEQYVKTTDEEYLAYTQAILKTLKKRRLTYLPGRIIAKLKGLFKRRNDGEERIKG